jgi:tRNA-dihydrouridine synthase B
VTIPALFIGPYRIDNPLLLAPMAGVTDKPFRVLCKRLGAGYAVSEMTTSDPQLWRSTKSRLRMDHSGEPEPVAVQLAGADPEALAAAARHNVELGAQIIDINMGCPAKKVCNTWAGSALLRDEPLVNSILVSVVKSVGVPVTVKIRTGWHVEHRNALRIARIAEDAGVAAIAIHGRTRDMQYNGEAEYDTIAEVRQAVRIPVIANGDIDSPAKALHVLRHTGAHALMIGRAAQGNPWIFREVEFFLRTGEILPAPSTEEVRDVMIAHVRALHAFHGEHRGVRIARKHLGWYMRGRPGERAFRDAINVEETAAGQLERIEMYFAERVMPALRACA